MGGVCSSPEDVLERAHQERLSRVPPIGLQVQQEDGPLCTVSVRPCEPVVPSLERELGLGPRQSVADVWLGQLRLENHASWESQGVVDGASVTAVVSEKVALLVVADSATHQVHLFRLADGSHVQTIGSKGQGLGQFDTPSGVAVDEEGNLIVADTGNHRVQVLRLDCSNAGQSYMIPLRSIGSYGLGRKMLQYPSDVAADGRGNTMVVDRGNCRVQVYRPADGSHVESFGSGGVGSTGADQFRFPTCLALDAQGNVLVTDADRRRAQLQVFRHGSHRRTIQGSGGARLARPWGVAVDGQGNLLVTDADTNLVQVFRVEDSSYVRTIGAPGQFASPRGLMLDGEGNLIVADAGNHRVQVLRLEDGSHVRTIGSGVVSAPTGVALILVSPAAFRAPL